MINSIGNTKIYNNYMQANISNNAKEVSNDKSTPVEEETGVNNKIDQIPENTSKDLKPNSSNDEKSLLVKLLEKYDIKGEGGYLSYKSDTANYIFSARFVKEFEGHENGEQLFSDILEGKLTYAEAYAELGLPSTQQSGEFGTYQKDLDQGEDEFYLKITKKLSKIREAKGMDPRGCILDEISSYMENKSNNLMNQLI